jgi:hypothetical protein
MFSDNPPELARFSLAACHGRREQLVVVSLGAVPEGLAEARTI